MAVVIPALLRALAIDLAPLVTILALLFIAYVAVMLIRAIFSPLTHIPFGVGHWLGGQLDSLAESVHNALAQVVNARAKPLAAFFVDLATELRVGWDATADFAEGLATDFAYWTTTGLHATIKAFTNAVLKVANEAHTIATKAQAGVIDLRKDVTYDLGVLKRYVETELFGRALAGIDALRYDVFGKAIPALEDWVGKIATGIANDVGAIGARLHDVETWISGLSKADILAGLAAIAGLATLVETIALESGLDSAECRRKVRGICGIDPEDWAQLLLGAVLIAEFPGLQELTRMGASVLDDVSGTLVELAES